MSDLTAYLDDRRALVEAALERTLPLGPEAVQPVTDAMRYSLLAGGKRLRPILAIAAAEAVGARLGLPQAEVHALVLPCACAIEMLHTYSLIHDDLPAMDDDTLRRGRPTAHVVHGEGMAILAGDGLQAEAFRLLAEEPVSADAAVHQRQLRTLALLATAAGRDGMVGGQAIDLDAVRPGPGRETVSLDAAALQRMHGLKTGALIRASAVSGAIMAGGDATTIAATDRYAAEAGLAFQIVDDILDVEGETAAIGKTAGKDAAAGKPTYPALFGLEASRALAEACLARAEAALGTIGLHESRLRDIARWIVRRDR